MKEVKHIHFGHFVRWKHFDMGLGVKEFSEKIGMSDRWLVGIEVEKKDPRDVTDVALGKLANGLGMTSAQLREKSRTTRVPVARFKDTGRSKKPRGAAREVDISIDSDETESSGKPKAQGDRKPPK